MFANYESSSDIKDLLVTIRNAIDKKLEIIDIKDDFDRVNNYRIFYNFEDLLSYDELELHVFVGYDELTMQEPKETIVIAFDFKIKSLLQNKTILYDSLCLNNIIFIHSSDLSFNIFDDDEKDLNIEVEANINKLYMIDCLFFKPITLAFDWDTIDLSSCIFLDSLSIYDLYNEFSSYYCNFDVIFMENHIFNKLEFNSCEAKRLELYPDQQDLDMEVININYSRLEELVINSREYYNSDLTPIYWTWCL